jgi:homoserine dehydrogenase
LIMTNKSQIDVLKFGSSVLRDEHDLPRAVWEINRVRCLGSQVIAVVSAFGDTTDQLMKRAQNICSEPEQSALATLLATGEAASSALLVLALADAGIPARVLDPAQACLRTAGPILDADLISVDTRRLLAECRHTVVVLPGFVGRDETGGTTLLGRGGSDLTALFLSQRLNAHCMLFKDVDGLYTSNPNSLSSHASRFSQVSYRTAARVGGSVVQAKAVHFAESERQHFTITSIGSTTGTEVGPFNDCLYPTPAYLSKVSCVIHEQEECVA